MNTNQNQKQTPTPIRLANSAPPENSGQALTDLVSELWAVDPKTPDAEVNATSISDNNGGRITLVDDLKATDTIKK